MGRHPQVRQAIEQNLEGFKAMCNQAAGEGEDAEIDMEDPQAMQEMFAQLAANPQMLAQLAQSDPMIAQLIQNPQALAMLQQRMQQGGAGGGGGGLGGMPGLAGLGGAGGGGAGGAPAAPAQLTEEDNAAIERLMALGFDRNMVVEVYLGCGKNENLAANILFDGA